MAEVPSQSKSADVERCRSNYLSEMDGAALYRALASREENEKRRRVLEKLVEAEERHAGRWAELPARPAPRYPRIAPPAARESSPSSLTPFLLTGVFGNVIAASALAPAAALFLVGAVLSVFTSRGALVSGARMLLIGCAAAAVTYAVGGWLGVEAYG